VNDGARDRGPGLDGPDSAWEAKSLPTDELAVGVPLQLLQHGVDDVLDPGVVYGVVRAEVVLVFGLQPADVVVGVPAGSEWAQNGVGRGGRWVVLGVWRGVHVLALLLSSTHMTMWTLILPGTGELVVLYF
jgi:hypothetical protein